MIKINLTDTNIIEKFYKFLDKMFDEFCTELDEFLEDIILIPLKIRLYFIARKCFKILKIKPIPLLYEYAYNNVDYDSKTKILFGQKVIFDIKKEIWDKILFDFINWNISTEFERMAFVLCHEIGHHLQATNYSRWYHIQRKIKNSVDNLYKSHKEYREFKLEASADKIAIGLCKRLNIGKPKTKSTYTIGRV